MPTQPGAGAFKASTWFPAARTRFLTLAPGARGLPSICQKHPSDNRSSNSNMSTSTPPATSAGRVSKASPNNQTWNPSNGIVFGRSPSASQASNHNSKPTRQMHTEEGNGSRSPRGDVPRRTRPQPARKAKVVAQSRTLSSHCISSGGDVSLDPPAGTETVEAIRELVFQSRSLNLDGGSEGRDGPGIKSLLQQPASPSSEYRMSDEALEAAQQANQYWEFGLYRNSAGHKPRLHYCRKRDASEQVAQLFLEDAAPILGFDLEWKMPNMRRRASSSSTPVRSIKDNVSLIQLASESRVALFHIALHRGSTAEELLAPSLRRILESAAVTKVGVNINGDCTRLRTSLAVDVRRRLELSHLHKLVRWVGVDDTKINRKVVSLDKLVDEYLGLPLWKGGEVRTGHWERELDMDQLKYAASDAYAGLKLYQVLDARRRALRPTPPMPWPAETRLPIRLAGADADDDDDADVLAAGIGNEVDVETDVMAFGEQLDEEQIRHDNDVEEADAAEDRDASWRPTR